MDCMGRGMGGKRKSLVAWPTVEARFKKKLIRSER